ncbi:MAG: VWA domain-containing protein [Trueperaceae bacterium]|nr:VWA domain-containing protein [Trueperaceae bacterium]
MLNTKLTPHREYLLADTAGQKLFLALSLRPDPDAAKTRPQLAIAFVVDTSGSMREVVTEPTERTGQTTVVDGATYEVVRGAKSKIELVTEALQGILGDDTLEDDDRIAIVGFDDQARVIAPFTPARERRRLQSSADTLGQYSGGTRMGAGMREGLRLLSSETGSRRMVLLTDGHTFDEDLVKSLVADLRAQRVSVTTVGVGDTNEDLLIDLTDKTQGNLVDVVPDNQNPQPPAVRASELPAAFLGDVKKAASEVVTDLSLNVMTVRDVSIDRITRVYPVQSEVEVGEQPFFLGSAAAGDETVFVIEFTLPKRPPARMRLAQLGLSYQVPGADYRGELPPMDVVVEFTNDEARAAQIDPQVMQRVQQRNVEQLIKRATREAQTDPEQAAKTIALAKSMTVRLGNDVMTQALDRAENELQSSKTISLNTAKTLKIGAKTQTLRMDQSDDLPSDDDIRKMTGA